MWGRYLLRHPMRKVYPGYLKRDRHLVAKRVIYLLLVFSSMLVVVASAGAFTYKVKERDTLYSISNATKVSQEQIRLANKLEGDLIKVGQELVIPYDFYVVAPGEGWYSVIRNSRVSLEMLLKLNRLTPSTTLHPYAQLRIPVDASLQRVHVVQEHDSWEVLESLYTLSEEKLRQFNGMTKTDELKAGMTIVLVPGLIETHLVKEGETLYSLANRYGVSVDQLMQYNALNTDIIRAGALLRISDPMVDNSSSRNLLDEFQQWEDILSTIEPTPDPEPLIDAKEIRYAYFKPATLYFNRPPSVNTQPSVHYAEPQVADVKSDYAEAIALYNHFKEDVEQLPKLSETLKGYKIMLDPGHGGYDPGALGTVQLNGKSYHLVEDEYVYDIALRLYAVLIQHGAEVDMTILAPNHTIRNNENLESFVNQKNEVYNDAKESKRPIGGRWGLKKRVELTQKFLSGHDKKRSIFMSLHADSGDVSGLILTAPRHNDATKMLANSIIKEFQQGKIISDDYLVLKDNPAYASVLVEVRTMSQEEASFLLDPKQRQLDAERLANAILAYAEQVKGE